MVKQIFIVRHTTRQDTVQSNWAETAEYGYNPPLADLGHSQATEAGRYIRSLMHQQPTRVMVHTSPFLRCVQTAAHIAEELIGCNPKNRMDAALGEWLTPDYFANSSPPPDDNHADLANQAVSALQRQSKLRLVENGWNITCLGDSGSMREFWSEMHLRFEHYLKRLNGFYSKHNRKIETLIIVTHGAGVSSLLTHFCGEPVLSEIRLGSISLVSRDEEADEAGSFASAGNNSKDSGSRSRAGSITNWAWLGPDQVEEKFSIGSWQLDLLNVAAGTTGAAHNGSVPGRSNVDGLAPPGSDMSMKRRTSSPAMFMLNTTFLGSAPPSTRTSRASSLLRPSGPPQILSVPEGVVTGDSASQKAWVAATTDSTSAAASSAAASSATASAAVSSPAAARTSGGSQLTPSASVPAMLDVESGSRRQEPSTISGSASRAPESSDAPSTPPSESPEGSPTTSPQFSSGTWLLGSNRW